MSSPAESVPTAAVPDIPVDAFMLDVREAEEWAAGRAPSARHVPMSQLAARVTEVPREDPLYVVCRSGMRSARVVAYLADQGYAAVNVEGGMHAWVGAGRPLTADGGRRPEII
ncbi:MAG: rhodanese-like domain-containing protein [Pseudonocardia sp.]